MIWLISNQIKKWGASAGQTLAVKEGLHSFSKYGNLHATTMWGKSEATDTLDRDQPTRQFFPNTPRRDEPDSAVDYFYIQADYDDTFPKPFARHHTDRFCLVRVSVAEADGKINLQWLRSPLEDCAKQYQGLTASMRLTRKMDHLIPP